MVVKIKFKSTKIQLIELIDRLKILVDRKIRMPKIEVLLFSIFYKYQLKNAKEESVYLLVKK